MPLKIGTAHKAGKSDFHRKRDGGEQSRPNRQRYGKKPQPRQKIIIGETEHPSVIETAHHLEALGFQIVKIPSPQGVWDMDTYEKALSPDTILVSAMLVNNETGAVNDIAAVAAAARAANPDVLIHCDAVQGFLKTEICPAVAADMVTLSAHKIGGPKGVGALYINDKIIKTRAISPVVFGGGQERGFRSGTENVAGIAGFGAAAEHGAKTLPSFLSGIARLRERLENGISAFAGHGVRINRPQTAVIANHIISLTVPGYPQRNAAAQSLGRRRIRFERLRLLLEHRTCKLCSALFRTLRCRCGRNRPHLARCAEYGRGHHGALRFLGPRTATAGKNKMIF